MENSEKSTVESRIPPVVLRQEYLEREADKKQRAAERKQAEAEAEAALRDHAEYPVDALGPILGPAVEAIARKVQCPAALAGLDILSAMALAAQCVANVRMPWGSDIPLSIYALMVGHTEEPKSGVDAEVMKPIEARQKELNKECAERAEAKKRKHAVWKFEHDAIVKDKIIDAEIKEKRLEGLGPEPLKPRRPQLTVGDVTQESVLKNLDEGYPSLGIFSPEGGQFLAGHGFALERKNASGATFSEIHDGKEVSRSRVGTGLVVLRNKRLSVGLFAQPKIAKAFLLDEDLGDQGLVGRFWVAFPDSIAGTRFWEGMPSGVDLPLANYFTAMMNLLRAVCTKDDAGEHLVLRALVMSPAAERAWTEYNNSIERQLAPRGRYLKVRGSANKSSGNAARVAGGQTLLENPLATTIPADVMKRAVVLASWHLEEALRIVEDGAVAQVVIDAQALYDWIISRPLDDDGLGWTVKIRDVQRGGPGERFRGSGDEGRAIRTAAMSWLVGDHLAYGNEPGRELYVRAPMTAN
jgi:Protein of unknown function (DUF3987)